MMFHKGAHDAMSATDGEIRAAARGIYEEYDNLHRC
jgi:hypothetical protein